MADWRYVGRPNWHGDAMQGVLAGLMGCVFGVIGVFALGVVFVPLAAVCAVVGIVRGISGRSVAGIGTSMLAGALTVLGFATSPSLWLVAVGLVVASHRPPSPTVTQAMPPRQYVPAPNSPQAMQQAFAATKAAIEDCKRKRLSGQLKSYVDSSRCANPRIIDAFQRVGYRYMDLIYTLCAKRTEIAEALDQGKMTDIQAEEQILQFTNTIVDHERQRDRGIK